MANTPAIDETQLGGMSVQDFKRMHDNHTHTINGETNVYLPCPTCIHCPDCPEHTLGLISYYRGIEAYWHER